MHLANIALKTDSLETRYDIFLLQYVQNPNDEIQFAYRLSNISDSCLHILHIYKYRERERGRERDT